MKRLVIDTPEEMISSLKALETAFGEEETGTLEQMINKAFAASKSTPVDVATLLSATARAGQSAAGAGISDEETFAAVATVANATKDANLAATQVSSLIQSAQSKGLLKEGDSLADLLDKMKKQKEELGEERFFKGMDRNARRAFTTLSERRDLFNNIKSDVDRGNTENTARQVLDAQKVDAVVTNEIQRRQANAKLALKSEREALKTEQLDRLRRINSVAAAGQGVLAQADAAAENLAVSGVQKLAGADAAIRTMEIAEGQDAEVLSEIKRIRETNEQIAEEERMLRKIQEEEKRKVQAEREANIILSAGRSRGRLAPALNAGGNSE